MGDVRWEMGDGRCEMRDGMGFGSAVVVVVTGDWL